jgi:hypothetical protein
VPLDAEHDAAVTIAPREAGVYALSPFPFAPTDAEFAFAGRRATPHNDQENGHWTDVLKRTPTEWERFRLVPA